MKLNIGCFTTMFKGWLNIDIEPLQIYALQHGYHFMQLNAVTQMNVFPPGSVSLIYSSHFLEHITYDEGIQFLSACRVLLSATGCMRIAVPDLALLVQRYEANAFTELDFDNPECRKMPMAAMKLWHMATSNHKAGYDYPTLEFIAAKAGLRAERREFGQGHPEITTTTSDQHRSHSLYAELFPQ